MFGSALRVFCALILGGILTTNPLASEVYEEYYYSTHNKSKLTWMIMPDDNGLVVSAIISGIAPKQRAHIDQVRFHLWTRENPHEAETASFAEDNVRFLNFNKINPNRSTVFLIHGFTDTSKKPEFFNIMVKAFLEHEDCNVIGVNWTSLARIPWYGQAVKNTFLVGLRTGQAISVVRNLSPSTPSQIHVVGHNLGALVAGVAGHYVKNFRIGRITGLDPAVISTRDLPASKKLDKGDADLVEIIHTSGNYIGVSEPLGHRDFYPNGGVWPQPGCLYDIADRCSPVRAFQYYAEALTVKDSFLATRCTSYADYLAQKCDGEPKIKLVNDVGSDDLAGGRMFECTQALIPFILPRW